MVYINAYSDEEFTDACDISGLTHNYRINPRMFEHAIISFDDDNLADIELELDGKEIQDWAWCKLGVTDPVELTKHNLDNCLWHEVIHMFKIIPGSLKISNSIKSLKK